MQRRRYEEDFPAVVYGGFITSGIVLVTAILIFGLAILDLATLVDIVNVARDASTEPSNGGTP